MRILDRLLRRRAVRPAHRTTDADDEKTRELERAIHFNQAIELVEIRRAQQDEDELMNVHRRDARGRPRPGPGKS